MRAPVTNIIFNELNKLLMDHVAKDFGEAFNMARYSKFIEDVVNN